MSSSQWENLLEKFAKGFNTLGIYLFDSGRHIVLNQTDPIGLAILRRHISEIPKEEILSIEEETGNFKAIFSQLPDSSVYIVILCHEKNFSSIQKHWSRTRKVIEKKIPIGKIVEEENIQTKIVRIMTAIEENLDVIEDKIRSLHRIET